MTETPGDLAALEPLEPLETGGPGAAPGMMTADEAMLQAMRSGLPAPGINPYCRDKSFYKFLWAGVIMFLGCMMPFDANQAAAGYQTMGGAVYMLIAVAMVWTWWGAIAANRSSGASLKWLLFCFIPLIAVIWNMAVFESTKAFELAVARGYVPQDLVFSSGWGAMFVDFKSAVMKDADAPIRVAGFWRLFGTGQFFVLLGAVIAEFGLIFGVLGGAKQNKQLKQQKQMAAAEKRRAAKK